MEWQPIETAPKDGAEFLAYWPDPIINRNDAWDICRTWFWPADRSWHTTSHSMHELELETPTHWMPLPEPPK